ncbi:glycosyltransferase family 4 protein [Candidatus Saccharibacteria bacterium]|nr:glycosyltransferase family 4 protein [Candidatus Saccharibacteria bacterium]
MTDYMVFIITEVRVYKVSDHVYADASFAKILERYHRNFKKIVLATRIIDETKKRNGYVQIDDYCCCFDNIGSIGRFLTKKTSPGIIKHVRESGLVIMRLPSLVSLKINRLMKKNSKHNMVEVMGCAWDAYWNHGIVGKVIAPFMFFKTRSIVKKADYCVYVTQAFLQRRYPNNNKTIGLSNVDIESVEKPKDYSHFDSKNFTMMTAAALDVYYKGQQYVIKAISKLKKKYGINVKYYLAGKGNSVELKSVAKKYGVEQNVIILGMLPHTELHKYMRQTDIYIQPSLQEGLPRSLIEAMSCGCVCLGSNIAGIPELLDDDQLFKAGKTASMIHAILDTISSNALSEKSKRNSDKAKAYLNDELENKRDSFLQMIVRETK